MPDSSVSLILRALEPARSVVVEACAGCDKTWLLASRIVRGLLAGLRPARFWRSLSRARRRARSRNVSSSGCPLLANVSDQEAHPITGSKRRSIDWAGGLAFGDTLPMHSSLPPDAVQGPASALCAPWPPVGERRRPRDAAERFGILMHA